LGIYIEIEMVKTNQIDKDYQKLIKTATQRCMWTKYVFNLYVYKQEL
jgi:hypothetical protein